MFHVVYLSASAIGVSDLRTETGSLLLVSTLRSLLQNCLLVSFSDYRFDDEVKTQVANLPSQTQIPVMHLLTAFKKRQRILYVLQDDYSGKGELEIVASEASKLLLELTILDEPEAWTKITTKIPSVSIVLYGLSEFESQRASDVSSRAIVDGAMPGEEFIRRFLLVMIKYAQHMTIVDGTLGKFFRDDYVYTLDKLFRYFGSNARDLQELTIHCELGQGKIPDNLVGTVKELAEKYKLNASIKVTFYENGTRASLPHDRFMACEFGNLDIGRGLDFIARGTGLVRNTTIGLCDSDISSILDPFVSFRREDDNS